MAEVGWDFATLEDALRAFGGRTVEVPLTDRASKRRRVFRSVFQTDITQPTPNATPIAGFPEQGQAFGVPAAAAGQPPALASSSDDDLVLPDANSETAAQRRGGRDVRLSGVFSQLLPQGGGGGGGGRRTAAADDQQRYDRAWHVVTARIALPSSVSVDDSFGTLAPESQIPSQEAASEGAFQEALHLVLYAHAALPGATQTEDLLAWHTHQVRHHYAQHVLPMLSACADGVPVVSRAGRGQGEQDRAHRHEQHLTVVQNSVRTLEAAFRLYFYGMMLIARGLPGSQSEEGGQEGGQGDGQPLLASADAVLSRFRQDVHALVANSAAPGLMRSIREVFGLSCSILLGLAAADTAAPLPTPQPPGDGDAAAQTVRQSMHGLLESLHSVGLAGNPFQTLFAELMDEKMMEFIRLSFAGRWTTAVAPAPSSSISLLYSWIENHFARLAHEVLSHLVPGKQQAVSFSDVKKWKEIGLGRLSALRMTELLDIVYHWPRSRGGLEDLRVSVTTPQRRSQLVATFTAALRARLLNPACSTLEILQTYVAMIRTFHVLDPSNVLLSSAVGPLQLYLCQRDDAVRIVVDGLLADPEEDAAEAAGGATVAERIAASISSPSRGKLTELAVILNDPAQQRRRHVDAEELDWNDMAWVPDPIDAGTNYRRPKSEDVIGSLISALGSREAFTKEFQNIIAERLLSAQVVFAKEVKVLNLLKKRFGEGSMQNCEVMIRDIQDSNRLDAIIRQALQQRGPMAHSGQDAAEAADAAKAVEYQAKILSRLYWPGLGDESFRLPTPVAAVQKRYEDRYEDRKAGRKLGWLNQLGQAAVELELADRTVSLQCKTYEAAVIYAFQDARGDGDEEEESATPPARRSTAELVDMLQIDEDLLDLALVFWQKQGVLRPDGSAADTYVVVERLNEEVAPAAAAAATTDGEQSARDGPDGPDSGSSTQTATGEPFAAAPRSSRRARADEAQRTVYWQFIVGMLTNSAASMPLAQIGMMMKMLIAEGFPWSNEELQEFLGEKVTDGELEVTGGKYRLVKK